MKNTHTFKTLFFILVCTCCITSCEKSDREADVPVEDEGFLGETGQSDSEIKLDSEILEPLLHKRYDASLDKEEAVALFRAEVLKFRKEHKETLKASYFYFDVWTRTSAYSHSQTDANVWAKFTFLTDKGHMFLPWTPLNNEGDDRQNNSWDFYYFGTHASSISWLEAKSAQVALQGTDGWHVKYFDIRVWASDQFSNATGNSRVLSNPEIWLDNATASGWDYYYTGYVGTGRTTFN